MGFRPYLAAISTHAWLYIQELCPALLGGPYGMSSLKAGWLYARQNYQPIALSLQAPPFIFYLGNQNYN